MTAGRTVLILIIALSLATAPLATAHAAPLKRWNEPKFKISWELPSDWIYASKPGRYIFSGPKGTDAYYATVTVQFTNREAKVATLAANVKYLEEQVIAKDLNGKVLEKSNLTVGGQPAMRVRALHNQFQKEYIVVERGDRKDVFYWFIYTAQPNPYAKYYPVYAAFLKSVQFTP